jgi:metal-responsive CopG/Arc/MetJ family transcriptional regulator
MSGPQRAKGQTAISVSLPKELLEEVDRRAGLLGLTRSGYLASLARADLVAGGDFVLREKPNSDQKADVSALVLDNLKPRNRKRS